MSTIHDTQRRVLSVARQLTSVAVRRAALETLSPEDVVQALDPETHEVRGTRRLTAVDTLPWPRRYVVDGEPVWEFDADGRQLLPWLEPVSGGLLLVRPWLTAGEASHLLWESAQPVVKPEFSWRLYALHMARVDAVVRADGQVFPEVPWCED